MQYRKRSKIKFYEYTESIFHKGVVTGFDKEDNYSKELPETFFVEQEEITFDEMINQFPEDYQETFSNFAQNIFNKGIDRGKSEIGKRSALKFSQYLNLERNKLILKRDVGDLEGF